MAGIKKGHRSEDQFRYMTFCLNPTKSEAILDRGRALSKIVNLGIKLHTAYDPAAILPKCHP